MKNRYHTGLSAALMLVAVTLSLPLHAQSINPTLDDVFSVRLGPFFTNFNTKVSVGGSDFDEERFLDDNTTTVGAFATWRITPKFHFNIGYSDISRDDSTTLAAGLPIGGITVPAGSVVGSSYATQQLPISIVYSFVKNDRTECVFHAGVSITTIENSIRITAPGTHTIKLVKKHVTEPLPTIGVFWNQAFSPQWSIHAQFGYLGLEVGDINADFWNGLAALEWRPAKNFGLGGAYLYNSASGTTTSTSGAQDFDYEYSGPFVYLVIGGGGR